MTRDLLHAIATDTRSALGWGLRRIARVGNWLLGPQLDDVVCRLSRDLGGDDEAPGVEYAYDNWMDDPA